MKKNLDDNYDITVDNMLDMTEKQEVNGFTLVNSEFYNKKDKKVNKHILVRDNEQIFSMKDGIFILEVEDDGMVEYFYSKDINDLI